MLTRKMAQIGFLISIGITAAAATTVFSLWFGILGGIVSGICPVGFALLMDVVCNPPYILDWGFSKDD